jgi:hypothetical protein
MKTLTRLEARWWFKKREAINWGVSAVCFIVLFLALMHVFDTWPGGTLLAGIIAIFPVLVLHFFVLGIPAISIACPHCPGYIETKTPWKCGYKNCLNENVGAYPFINKCEHCGYIPKAYQCHHCKELIFFTIDEQKTSYAQCANVSTPLRKVAPDAIGEKIDKHREEIRDLQHKYTKTKIESDIEIEKQRPIKTPEESARDLIRKEMQRLYNLKMEKEDAAQHLKAALTKQFEHQPFELEKRLAMVDEVMTEQL